MTFITDLDDLIRNRHGDVKKLREIRDTIRHDNFITTESKNYVESLINMHLKNLPSDKPLSHKQTDTKIKLQSKPTSSSSDSKSNIASSSSFNKKLGILGGAAAAIAIIIIIGFTGINQGDTIDSVMSTTPSNPLLITVDQTQYQRADIISISGDSVSDRELITLSIENTNGVKIWKENIEPKNGGNFSTLVIAGGGGWENSGSYTIKAVQTELSSGDSLQAEIKFQFVA